MKKETIYLLLFWAVIGTLIWYAFKLLKETNNAIAVSKGDIQGIKYSQPII